MTVHPAGTEGLAWLERRAPCVLTRNATGIEARDASGAICGVIGIDDVTPNACQLHVAIERPIAVRALTPALWNYLWNQLRVRMAFGMVRATNQRSLVFTARLGFQQAARLRDAWAAGEDMILLRKDAPNG